MTERVYSVIELVGTSDESWEKVAAASIEQDVHIESGKPHTFRVKMELSFKYEGDA